MDADLDKRIASSLDALIGGETPAPEKGSRAKAKGKGGRSASRAAELGLSLGFSNFELERIFF